METDFRSGGYDHRNKYSHTGRKRLQADKLAPNVRI